VTAPASRWLQRLRSDRRGVALTEFAVLLPLVMIVGFGGIELANFALTYVRINQIAVTLADNISRAKQASATGAPQLREFDIQDAFTAAMRQGADLRLQQRARLIVSSLEVNSSGGQWIHWQRCAGAKRYTPRYGSEGAGRTGTSFPGMGPPARRVTADPGGAVMVVEVAYDYHPLLSYLIPTTSEIVRSAAMTVRDDRDLSQIYNPAPAVAVASC
jgi:hypothetical protein